MVNKKLLISLGIIFCLVALTAAYRRPYAWWPVNDMNEQPIIKPFQANGLRDPVPGTIPVTGAWDPVPPKLEVAQNLHPDFTNPMEATAASLAEGKELYNIYCTSCHSEGMKPEPEFHTEVMKRGMPSATMPRISLMSDAEIFSTLTYGSAIMKRMDYHLSPEERWHVVNYVRQLINDYKAGQPAEQPAEQP